MFYVYVLKSLRNGKRYIGSTKILPIKRLKQHEQGSNKWTFQNRPFELVYEEAYSTNKEARDRERFLKMGVGRKMLDELLKKKAGSVSAGGFSLRLIRLWRRSALGGG